MKVFSLLLASLLIFSSVSYAGKSKGHSSSNNNAALLAAYDRLKDVGVDLQPTGTICEYLAKERLEEQYSPEQFQVVVGIQYGEERNAVGELDMTVIDLEYNEVVYIGEVKCWKNPSAGLKKAKDQLNRFMTYLRGGRVNWMKILAPGYDNLIMNSGHFQGNFDVGFMAQKGSRKSGYTGELEFTLREAMTLRNWIMECQREGKCKRPSGKRR